MSNLTPQPEREVAQEVRFSALAPAFDEALSFFEPEEYRTDKNFPGILFLFAGKRIQILDGKDLQSTQHNQSNPSIMAQYRQGVEVLSANGEREFPIVPGIREFRREGRGKELVAVGMRVMLDDASAQTLLKPPLYGPAHSVRPDDPSDIESFDDATRELAEVRKAKMLAVVYEIQARGGDHGLALAHLRSVLEMGVKVSQLTIVPHQPKAARYRDRFGSAKVGRFYTPPPKALKNNSEEAYPAMGPEEIQDLLDGIDKAS